MYIEEKKIIIFSETTVTKAEVLKYVSNADIVPSIKTGDMISAVKDNYEIAIIIDGNFDFTNSVWHKEILWAIEKGVKVIGCASMGALRAAELYDYGMLGSGYVFDCYKNAVTDDDSEVAISYFKFKDQIISTIPLINLRYTLFSVLSKIDNSNESATEILSQQRANELFDLLSKIFYKKRTWETIKQTLADDDYILLKKYYVDIKQKDAIYCLKNIDTILKTKVNTTKVPRTVCLNNLIRSKYYANDFLAIADILNNLYNSNAQKGQNYSFSPKDNSRISELYKLTKFDINICEFAISFLNAKECSMTNTGLNLSVELFRKNLNLVTGESFKKWCLTNNLNLDLVEQTFKDYLLLRKLIY